MDPNDPMSPKNPTAMRHPFTHYSPPPVAPVWPITQDNAPPCPKCNLAPLNAVVFQVNTVGPQQVAVGQPMVEVADVNFICPGCHIRYHRRYRSS